MWLPVSLSGVVWRFCRLLCSVAFAILCQFTVRVMDYCLTELIAKMGECPLAMQALCEDRMTAMLCSSGAIRMLCSNARVLELPSVHRRSAHGISTAFA